MDEFLDFGFDDFAVDDFAYDVPVDDFSEFFPDETFAESFDYGFEDVAYDFPADDFALDTGAFSAPEYDVFSADDAAQGESFWNAAANVTPEIATSGGFNFASLFAPAATIASKLIDFSTAQQTRETAQLVAQRNPYASAYPSAASAPYRVDPLTGRMVPASQPGASALPRASTGAPPLNMFKTVAPPGYKIDPKTGKLIPLTPWYKRTEVQIGAAAAFGLLLLTQHGKTYHSRGSHAKRRAHEKS